MDFFLWAGIVFLVIALLFVARDDLRLLSSGRLRARGTVIDHRRSDDGEGPSYSAMVRFTAHDGRSIEFQDIYGSGAPKPPVGTQIDVVYPVEAPDKARVPRFWTRAFMYAFLLGTLTVLVLKLVGWLKG